MFCFFCNFCFIDLHSSARAARALERTEAHLQSSTKPFLRDEKTTCLPVVKGKYNQIYAFQMFPILCGHQTQNSELIWAPSWFSSSSWPVRSVSGPVMSSFRQPLLDAHSEVTTVPLQLLDWQNEGIETASETVELHLQYASRSIYDSLSL